MRYDEPYEAVLLLERVNRRPQPQVETLASDVVLLRRLEVEGLVEFLPLRRVWVITELGRDLLRCRDRVWTVVAALKKRGRRVEGCSSTPPGSSPMQAPGGRS